jgi:hypothetical protein
MHSRQLFPPVSNEIRFKESSTSLRSSVEPTGMDFSCAYSFAGMKESWHAIARRYGRKSRDIKALAPAPIEVCGTGFAEPSHVTRRKIRP